MLVKSSSPISNTLGCFGAGKIDIRRLFVPPFAGDSIFDGALWTPCVAPLFRLMQRNPTRDQGAVTRNVRGFLLLLQNHVMQYSLHGDLAGF